MTELVEVYAVIALILFAAASISSIASKAGERAFEDISPTWAARVALCAPVWPLLILAAVAWLFRTLIRNAKGHDDA